ncbi:UDP-N-acetylmuramoyl-L-alanyl-D-glutamate--2,6-diaminopimelate ligase [Kocuria sp. SM24M-10]|uniref:UDP-N-acetylmuramoyl-L-alanyl-D-glutamate--2, 6-diaminopimelate ligase n=1 Tax=Kocuria sp. SM24M-10 TaxID=1660349 RepID=UPI00064B348A|nr:UDP-N-acetylmuramoyl-L-alanyl-D-glutamate--2,6-diaminopimelate ligase [Kocuria sp. SM24M-10]KLU11013.1 UDP-N-acetylmuramoylalanyl-D-glutamate--2,6-diaminopimelate ligase [Kocuria sp. SM24M-10]
MDATAQQGHDAQTMRPARPRPLSLTEVARLAGAADPARTVDVTGISLDSRQLRRGDLYAALPGARAHGAQFAPQAERAGAAAVLTDAEGAGLLERTGVDLPVVVAPDPRRSVGTIAARVYGSRPEDGTAPVLLAVTGTNGKTTTTYFTNSLLRALGRTTGLIGTIEILAGEQAIPSRLTTPEAPHVHALLALMRERGITAASMEVSSHALEFSRVDGVRFDVAGFTNLTQDHLDLHGSMEEYFSVKARLFTPGRTGRAVVVLQDEDDVWGARMAAHARAQLGADRVDTIALRGDVAEDRDAGPERHGADWTLTALTRRGIGHSFTLVHRDGRSLRVSTGLPGDFNVANAALAVVMVLASGTDVGQLQRVLDEQDPLTTDVPGRMQLIGTEPTAVVDFAHNPDALRRALAAVQPPEEQGRVIVVFGATGERDRTKRPVMGAVAARHADVVIVTDDDPHDEEPAGIREEVAAGARAADGARVEEVLVLAPRAVAIRAAVAMAGPGDSVLVAGRGHETVQEIRGVDHPLDDREELRAALADARQGRREDR